MYHLFNNYGGKDMMYRTELLEEITIENATVKINAKIEEMEKESPCHNVILGNRKGCIGFQKRIKGQFALICSYLNRKLLILN